MSPDLPVILTTGNRDPEYEERSLELRASYLEKPFSGAHLLDTMASSLPSEPAAAAL